MKRNAIALLLLLMFIFTPLFAEERASEDKRTCKLDREYYLYTPKNIFKSRKYRLVVGVHRYNGSAKNAAGLSSWASRGDCIVLSPQFPSQ